jgi:hypothetical protein
MYQQQGYKWITITLDVGSLFYDCHSRTLGPTVIEG